MRVKKENFVNGSCFHIYNHAVEHLNLFRVNNDYLRVLSRFKQKILTYPATIFSYCLMPNHYHFFIRQDSDVPIYKIFNDIFSGYTLYYNHKYSRKGTLFRSPLQHKIIATEEYFIRLSLYIHFNPVKSNLVKRPEDWIYSNYLEWIGKRKGKLFCKEVWDWFDLTPLEYSKMMEVYSDEKYEEDRKLFE